MSLAFLLFLSAPARAEKPAPARIAPPSCQELQLALCGKDADPGKCLRREDAKLPLRCRILQPKNDKRGLVEPDAESASLDKSRNPGAPERRFERGEVKEVIAPGPQARRLRLKRFQKTPDAQR